MIRRGPHRLTLKVGSEKIAVMRRLLMLACCVLLTGCGGGESDEDQALDVAQRYVAALTDGDGQEACPLLTPAAGQQLASDLGGEFPELGVRTCEEAVRAIGENLRPDQKDALRSAQLSARVRGSSATVTAEGGSSAMGLTKLKDGWRISTGFES